MCSPRPAPISIVVLNPGCECLTEKVWLNVSMSRKRRGSCSSQSFMNASLVRVCSGVIGGRTFGHLAGCMMLNLARHQRKTLQEMKIRASQRELRMLRITQAHEFGIVVVE